MKITLSSDMSTLRSTKEFHFVLLNLGPNPENMKREEKNLKYVRKYCLDFSEFGPNICWDN